jgi:NAD(P)H-hydrate epimerase
MSGAPYLAAKAALRCCCGLAEIVAPEENRMIHQLQLPEAIVTSYTPENAAEVLKKALSRADAVAIGMGLGQGEIAALLVKIALEEVRVPLIVDADALNLIAASPALLAILYGRSAPTVITPHLGEMSRLAGLPIPAISADLVGTAARFAKAAGVLTVLKDARTVISDGENHYLNAFGNSGMATGGSGDVLAGVIASFASQGASPDAAAFLGVLTHALAGDAAAARLGERSVMASDIIDGLSPVLSEF